jgi:hypothetical protein
VIGRLYIVLKFIIKIAHVAWMAEINHPQHIEIWWRNKNNLKQESKTVLVNSIFIRDLYYG